MYKCECWKEYKNKQSYVAHCGHCKIHLGRDPIDRFGDSRAWMRGLTKNTDSRVRRLSEISSKSKSGKPGHPHTEEFKIRISEISRNNAKSHKNGWKAGNNRIPNKYEEFTSEFLSENRLSYESEVVIPKSSLQSSEGGYYQLDFLVNGTIDLEIDGSSHSSHHDEIRDQLLSSKYIIYRISHHDSIEELRTKLNEFLIYINQIYT